MKTILLLVTLLISKPFFLFGTIDIESVNSSSCVDDFDIKVFFAQTHVQEPEDPFFKLIQKKETLLKVNITSATVTTAPPVNATLKLNGEILTLALTGPSTITNFIDYSTGVVQHTFENSFVVPIPKEWMQAGLEVVITVADQVLTYNNFIFSAPNKVFLKMFDIHFFEYTSDNYPEGWQQELQNKWPVSEIELNRLPNIVFEEVTVPPRPNKSLPAIRVSSKEEYREITGLRFDGEQNASSKWVNALKAAAGFNTGNTQLFYVNIYGVPGGGQAGTFSGVGNGRDEGVLNHELGHALALPHWGSKPEYPYKGDLFGIEAPDTTNETHVGPTWGYDATKQLFIPPTVQENSVGGIVGQYKKSPMQGGGEGDQEEGFLMRHFSDFGMDRSRTFLENHLVVWNETLNAYAKWNSATNRYSDIVPNNGLEYATERNVEVISILAGVSSTTPEANILYRPIGPYVSGLIQTFDPTVASDRADAAALYCPDGGCDVSVRVEQGGTSKIYMLPIELKPDANPIADNSYKNRAINVPASDGEVTFVELLNTPDAEINGIPPSDTVLDTWGTPTTVCSLATIWNGTIWDKGQPLSSTEAIINADYDMNVLPSIDACAIKLRNGATLTIASGTYVNVTANVVIDAGAELIIEHEGSLVQIDDTAIVTNNGTITVAKKTPALGFREFSVMSSPMSASTRDVALADARIVFAHNTANFDLNTDVSAAFGDAVNFVDQTGDDRIPMETDEPLEVATGYIVIPNGPGPESTYTASYTQGTLNNGKVDKELVYNGTPEGSPNLIGNPYPSAFNAFDFLDANPQVPELYFWNQNTTPIEGPGYLAYSMEDISYFNSSGGNAAASDSGNIPDEFVASGQGFGVKPTSNASVTFNNSMRVKTNNFNFRSASTANDNGNRIWLQLSNAAYNESTSTTLIAFLDAATDNLDTGYDSKRIGTYVSLFSQAEDQELGIQGRSAFNENARVTMGFRTLLEETTAYTISVSQLQGDAISTVDVYLRDIASSTLINLSKQDYTFVATEGHYPNQFELSFGSKNLDTNDLDFADATLLLYPNPANTVLTVRNTSNEAIQKLQMIDLKGRLMLSQDIDSQATFDIFVGQLPSGVYIVKLQSKNNEVIKKLIKR